MCCTQHEISEITRRAVSDYFAASEAENRKISARLAKIWGFEPQASSLRTTRSYYAQLCGRHVKRAGSIFKTGAINRSTARPTELRLRDLFWHW